MPTRSWGYVRVSTDEQLRSTLGIRGYIAKIIRYADDHDLDLGPEITISIEKEKVQSRNRIVIDTVSASKVKFFQRPAVRYILDNRQKDDALIISKVDRAFRSMRDAFTVTSELRDRKIPLHFVDLAGMNVSLDAPNKIEAAMAEMFLALMAFAAQMESAHISQRTTEAHAAAVARGRPITNAPPPGFKFSNTGKNRKLVVDHEQLALLRQIKAWMDRGWGRMRIQRMLEELDIDVPGRPDWAVRIYGSRGWRDKTDDWMRAAKGIDEIEKNTGVRPDEGRAWLDEIRKKALENAKQKFLAKRSYYERKKNAITVEGLSIEP